MGRELASVTFLWDRQHAEDAYKEGFASSKLGRFLLRYGVVGTSLVAFLVLLVSDGICRAEVFPDGLSWSWVNVAAKALLCVPLGAALGWLAWGALKWLGRRAPSIMLSEDTGLDGQYKTVLRERGLSTEGPNGESHTNWERFQDVRATDSFVFLLSRGAVDVVVPADAFGDASEKEAFVRIARERITAHKPAERG